VETDVVLVVGAVLLCCGCGGLLIVRLSNPFLKGLGWIGGSFAAGALGAAVLASPGISADASAIIAYSLILLAYVLLHVGILELMAGRPRLPKLGLTLLLGQAIAFPGFLYTHHGRQLYLVTLAIMLAVQALQTAALLKNSVIAGMDPPIWFTVVLLLGFAGFNLFRGIAVLILGTPADPRAPAPFETMAAMVFLGIGLGLGFGVFWIATAKSRLSLELLANTDPLTGAYNRRSFVALCEKELLRSSRSRQPFSLLMIDLDYFKKINDHYGHENGDIVLCAVARALQDSLRNVDVVGRWGGEEFVALLPDTPAELAVIVAHRLRHTIQSLSIAKLQTTPIHDKNSIAVTISLGVATYPNQANNIEDLLQRGDRALYQAKADGRNCVVQQELSTLPQRRDPGAATTSPDSGSGQFARASDLDLSGSAR
jgi:diguanylate cyclase (GGDEF)-like protein